MAWPTRSVPLPFGSLGLLGVATLIVNHPAVEAGGSDGVSTFMHHFFQVTASKQLISHLGFRCAVLF